MKTLSKNQGLRRSFISSLLAGVFCCSAHAGVYTFNYTDTGLVPQGGTVFSAEQAISSITLPGPSITSIELILTFQDAASLSGNSSSGIQGSLNLGTGTGSPFVSFSPVETSASGLQKIYDVVFSGSSGTPGTGFFGLNPNATWGLVLWDNSGSGIENDLESWSLNITAVPEPINVALGIFGGVMGLVALARSRPVKRLILGKMKS